MPYTGKNNTSAKPTESYLFLSDVHLGAWPEDENRKMEKELIALIDFCEEHRIRIIILGDFFDYWMEYPDRQPPIGQNILRRFKEYHQHSGRQSLFVTGNHDNWTTGYLGSLGFDIEHEYRILESGGLRFLVLHGDGLSNPEMKLPRPLMHRFLRNSYFIKLYQALLPPHLGWQVMKWLSGNSKKTTRIESDEYKRDMLNSWAREHVKKNKSIQAIIYGHHHFPYKWHLKKNVCLNPGSFDIYRTVGIYTNKKFQIVTWDADKHLFISDQTEILSIE